MRNLDNHRYIGEAIQLLQAKGDKVKVPLWWKVLDWSIVILILSIPVTLLIWLVKILIS
jgi:hypothetical protein